MTQRTYDAIGKPTWNYTKAVEPVSRKPELKAETMTPAAKTRYAVLIAIMIVGAVLAVSGDAVSRDVGATAFGWALAHFWCWPSPH